MNMISFTNKKIQVNKKVHLLLDLQICPTSILDPQISALEIRTPNPFECLKLASCRGLTTFFIFIFLKD